MIPHNQFPCNYPNSHVDLPTHFIKFSATNMVDWRVHSGCSIPWESKVCSSLRPIKRVVFILAFTADIGGFYNQCSERLVRRSYPMLVREQVLQGVGSRKMGIKHCRLPCGVRWQPLLRQGMLHPAHQHGNDRLCEGCMAAMPERVYT